MEQLVVSLYGQFRHRSRRPERPKPLIEACQISHPFATDRVDEVAFFQARDLGWPSGGNVHHHHVRLEFLGDDAKPWPRGVGRPA